MDLNFGGILFHSVVTKTVQKLCYLFEKYLIYFTIIPRLCPKEHEHLKVEEMNTKTTSSNIRSECCPLSDQARLIWKHLSRTWRKRTEDTMLIYTEDLVPDRIASTKVCRWLVVLKEQEEVLVSRIGRQHQGR